MVKENKDDADLNETFTKKVAAAVVDQAKLVVGGSDAELDALIEDGSPAALQKMADEHGSILSYSKVFDAFEKIGGEQAMSLIADVVRRASENTVMSSNYEATVLSGIVDQALGIWERNGNDAAIRGVYAVMKDPNSDDHLFNTCQNIINNTGNVAVQKDMQALLDNKLPETFEDPSLAASTNEL
ncbi:MAG: hypothetical protein COA45_06785 [Zetaproteobacteria bacterium]|nr:MAG: hypothetical protein COA45_06785 [Zetaproteobacteria bacterium]